MKKAYTSNPLTDCSYYPESAKYAIINNTAEVQETVFTDVNGKEEKIVLQPSEIVWKR